MDEGVLTVWRCLCVWVGGGRFMDLCGIRCLCITYMFMTPCIYLLICIFLPSSVSF